MRRAGGFTYGLLNLQLGRTYQNGHPGVTTMWVAMLTLGPQRMLQYADRIHNQLLVGRVPGFWDALVDARPGSRWLTALLVTLIAGLAYRCSGRWSGALTGLLLALEPFYLAISQLVHMDAILGRRHGRLGAGGAGPLEPGRRARPADPLGRAGRPVDPLRGAGHLPAGVRAGARGSGLLEPVARRGFAAGRWTAARLRWCSSRLSSRADLGCPRRLRS